MKAPAVYLPVSLLLLAASPEMVRADSSVLALKAQAILKAHCYRCHGQDGTAKGGFGYVLEPAQLVARDKVVPGKPTESELYRRVAKGEMPPKGKAARPRKDDLAILQMWIEVGAPAATVTAARPFLSDQALQGLVLADLKALAPRQRRFVRYLSLAHLSNAGRGEEELEAARLAVAKLINSLSWHPRISVPQGIDAARLVLRLDLRDYKWNARTWDRILSLYPYRISDSSSEARTIAALTGSELPLIRADWLVATASRAPLYHDVLQLPVSDRELERQLRVEALVDIQEERVIRSGFNGSGVSKNNRLLERHDAVYGAYWRSYDFNDNTGRKNLFEHPLGPLTGENSFEPAGGEVIFHLPNGLQGYMLLNGNGQRVDRAPIEIVSDPKRPDRIVETGVSCMSCHVRGSIPKADQVRAHVEKNPTAFARADVETVKALYPPEARMRAALDEDNERYLKALTKTGAHLAENDPVMATTLYYEAPLDLAAAAAETGLSPKDFITRLGRTPSLGRILGPLQGKGGTVQRDVFLLSFPDLVREFRLGSGDRPIAAVEPSTVTARPFAGHTGPVLCIAFSADGRLALSGSEDRTIRLWEVASGNPLRRFTGHADAVFSVAFSPDGRLAISGGADRTVRLWEVESGKELRSLMGHTDRVRSVAFSPDGGLAISGSQDRSIRLWDVASGKEVRSFIGHEQQVSNVVFAPDGKRILSSGYDRAVRLWDVESGKEMLRLDGHTREVYSVVFSADGKHAASGGNDRTVRLWDLENGKEIRRFEGHANAVIGVSFSADGRLILSGSSQYRSVDRTLRMWDLATGRPLRSFGGADTDRVTTVAFSRRDGRWALTSTPEDQSLRRWNLSD